MPQNGTPVLLKEPYFSSLRITLSSSSSFFPYPSNTDGPERVVNMLRSGPAKDDPGQPERAGRPGGSSRIKSNAGICEPAVHWQMWCCERTESISRALSRPDEAVSNHRTILYAQQGTPFPDRECRWIGRGLPRHRILSRQKPLSQSSVPALHRTVQPLPCKR